MDAITAINMIKLRKLKSTSINSFPNQTKAPGFKRNSFIRYPIGTVIPNTKITAKPSPTEVFTVLETAI